MADLLDFGGRPLMALLPERLRLRMTDAASTIRYASGETIHSRGDAKPGLSIVREGSVRFAIPGADGSYITSSILGPGQCFGEATLFAQLPRTHDAIAVEATAIDQITKSRFDRIFDEEPELARLFLEATTQRLYSVLDFMDDIRRLPLPLQTAKLIAAMARSAKQSRGVECNQSDLAFTLGVSRVSVGKALGRLQDEGVIQLGYGRIEIPDRILLEQWIADRSPLAPLAAS
ncbi:MAG: Crp/Fnr family transcriptional regulator [Pseudomonadota bacterium]